MPPVFLPALLEEHAYVGVELDGASASAAQSSAATYAKRSRAVEPEAEEPSRSADARGGFVCAVSGGIRFETLEAFKAHCRSDWYRYNLKQRARSQPPVSEDEFEALVESGVELDEISGSDSSDEEDEGATGAASAAGPVVFFRSAHERFGVFRCTLTVGEEPTPADYALALRATAERARHGHWVVLLCRGGHFAAAVARIAGARPRKGAHAAAPVSILAHKTIHRYVTRRKAGGRQSVADGVKNIKSAGSSIRRHNEAMLVREIRECLAAWRTEWVESAALILVAAPGPANASAIFGGADAPLSRADGRVRSIPFPTNRPTLGEVTRCAARLAQLLPPPEAPAEPAPQDDGRGAESAAPAAAQPSQRALARAAEAEARAAAAAEEEPPPPADLHAAAAADDAARVAELLAGGADPTIRHPDFRHRVAYDVAVGKEVRNAFRRHMGAAPDAWDWKAANVPSPLTDEQEAAAAERDKARERERRKRREKERKERKAQAAAESSQLQLELERAAAGLDADEIERLAKRAEELSVDVSAARGRVEALRREQAAWAAPEARRRREAEARALAMERRLGGGGGADAAARATRCHWCGKPLPATPFQKHFFDYCTTACVQAHGKEL